MYVFRGLGDFVTPQPQVELPNPTFDPSVWQTSSLNQSGGSVGLPGGGGMPGGSPLFPTVALPGIPGMPGFPTAPGMLPPCGTPGVMPGAPCTPTTPWWQGTLGIIALIGIGLVGYKILTK